MYCNTGLLAGNTILRNSVDVAGGKGVQTRRGGVRIIVLLYKGLERNEYLVKAKGEIDSSYNEVRG